MRKIKIAQIGTSRNSHGNEIFKCHKRNSDMFEIIGYNFPEAEDFIRNESNTNNWTIVRPVISFSEKRFDIVTINRKVVIDCARDGSSAFLPKIAKNLSAGLDWAGNSGKLIANLLFKKEALGQAFTISTA